MKIYTESELLEEFPDLGISDLIEQQGQTTYHLIQPSFHGGGVVSSHQSLLQALRRQRSIHNAHTGDRVVFGKRYPGHGCRCGGPYVLTTEQVDHLSVASNARSAYSPALKG